MPNILDGNGLWFKQGVIYELHVRAFCDSTGDGVGDFRGLTEKLDYLQDLGVTAVWLLPFFRSPLRDDGYDTSDYTRIHPAYGALGDFRRFLAEAHRRGLRVITELVLNHTSDQHPWFQRSRRAEPGSRWREFYVWSDTPDKYRDARIIFTDFESSNWTWDPVARAYYWHRFYSHQPDLNFDSPHVKQAMFEVVDFWLGMGVDGLRLDAVPYLYEREGTSCENLPETHAFLKELRRHVDERFRDRVFLAEANQWPEDAAAYFGDGDECHMAFHFPLMPRLFMAQRREDSFPVIDILEQTPGLCDNCQWALFLRNHDELTLEMVTDEERDYMYRAYAHDPQMRINLGIRRRLAPLLGNHRRRMELMNALLFSLPGTPIIYYGDEIGMGDNIYLGDRNGVRTPMQWNPDRNAGFSKANPQQLYLPVIIDPEYHYESVNVETQTNNPHSLLWWMKRLIAARKQSKSLSHGTIEFLRPENQRVLAFVRRHESECTLVVANLSRFVQPAELDLSQFRGICPVEMFGGVEFPRIGDLPYFVTLAPHSFYWFSLKMPEAAAVRTASDPAAYPIVAAGTCGQLFDVVKVPGIPRILTAHLNARAGHRSAARAIRAVRILDAVPVREEKAFILMLQLEYPHREPDRLAMFVAVAFGEKARKIEQDPARTPVIARLETGEGSGGLLYEAYADRDGSGYLLSAIASRRRFKGSAGEIVCGTSKHFRDLGADPILGTTLPEQRSEAGYTSITYGSGYVLKLFERLEPGTEPDLELGRFLTDQASFGHAPPVAGWIEYYGKAGEPLSLGVLHAGVAEHTDAWTHTLDALSRFLERALTQGSSAQVRSTAGALLDRASRDLPPIASDLLQNYMEDARLLGQRTAELHLALADSRNPGFAPEPFSNSYQQALCHGMVSQANRTLQMLRRQMKSVVVAGAGDLAASVLGLEGLIRERFLALRKVKLTGMRIRVHGDYQLQRLFWTGKDYAIADFGGDYSRSLSERRMKRSPLRDVASMIRSFHYASSAAYFGQVPGVIRRPDLLPLVEGWAARWFGWVSAIFLKAYVAGAGAAPFLPGGREELELLLEAFLLERTLHETQNELENRPDYLRIPLQGVLLLVSPES